MKNVIFYTWLETESGEGSNEVCSSLRDFLKRQCAKVRRNNIRFSNLFCDSCPGQNKNVSMVAAILQFVNSKENLFDKVNITFPIRGHSYCAADTVFGRLEK